MESHNNLGSIRVHKNVVANIAGIAACEIEGVKRVGTDFKGIILETLGRKFFSPVRIEFSKSGDVRITISLVINYGMNCPEIANRVQENVRLAVERMTNLSVKDVDVVIRGIEK